VIERHEVILPEYSDERLKSEDLLWSEYLLQVPTEYRQGLVVRINQLCFKRVVVPGSTPDENNHALVSTGVLMKDAYTQAIQELHEQLKSESEN
jgi:hypothetical protein